MILGLRQTHDKGLAIDVAIPGWDTATGKQLGNQINSFCKLTPLNLVLGTPFGMQCLIPLVVKADHIRIRDQTHHNLTVTILMFSLIKV